MGEKVTEDGEISVLVVEDEAQLAELFTAFLAPGYDVRTATSGQEALEMADEELDVVLLDRRMPDRSGDEVLAELVDRGVDAMFGMISGVDPDTDIVDMPFDDYLTKPVARDELLAFVETLELRSTFDACSQEFFQLASKRAALERAENDDTDEYHDLLERMKELRTEIDVTLDAVGPEPVEMGG